MVQSLGLPKPGSKKIEEEEVPPPDVECGDELYFRHPTHGPTHGKVAAHGKHGCMIDCAADKKRYRVKWEHVLGHRVKVQPGYKVVDHGESGFIAEDPSGRRRYIHDPDPGVDSGEEPIRKALPIVLLFGERPDMDVAKAIGGTRYIKNRPGLSLQDVTDKQGHQTKRWKKTGEDMPAEKNVGRKREEPTSTKHPVGTAVSFSAGGKSGSGKVQAAGADGAVVRDKAGNSHKVYWHEMNAGQRAGAGRRHAGPEERHTEPSVKRAPSADGVRIPPEHFHAHEYAEKYTDNDVTEDQIFARFEPEVREEMAEISKRVKALTQTIETHKPNGKWTPARAALHAKILAKIMSPEARQKARPKAGEKPCLTLLGGRGGSGKSKLKGVCYDPDTAIVLDADEIKKELPEYEGWNAGQVHEESSEVLDRLAVLCRRLKLNVVIDATMKSRDNLVKRATKYKSAGFTLATHYMFCPKQEAAYRTTSRFLGKDGKRGRYAPVDVVLSNVNNEANFEEVRKMSDKWSFHDNRAEHPVLISEGGNSATGKEK